MVHLAAPSLALISVSFARSPAGLSQRSVGCSEGGNIARCNKSSRTGEEDEVKPLTDKEREEFKRLDAQVIALAKLAKNDFELGRVLERIAERWLHRELEPVWHRYCVLRLGHCGKHGYRLINAWRVYKLLSPICDTLPANECQARPLTVLLVRPELLIQVWQTVVARAFGGKITGALVAKIVAEFLRPSQPVADPLSIIPQLAQEVREVRQGTLAHWRSAQLYTDNSVGSGEDIRAPLTGRRGGERKQIPEQPQEEVLETLLSWLLSVGPQRAAAIMGEQLLAEYGGQFACALHRQHRWSREVRLWSNQTIPPMSRHDLEFWTFSPERYAGYKADADASSPRS
jgi:hypothetical protein